MRILLILKSLLLGDSIGLEKVIEGIKGRDCRTVLMKHKHNIKEDIYFLVHLNINEKDNLSFYGQRRVLDSGRKGISSRGKKNFVREDFFVEERLPL